MYYVRAEQRMQLASVAMCNNTYDEFMITLRIKRRLIGQYKRYIEEKGVTNEEEILAEIEEFQEDKMEKHI